MPLLASALALCPFDCPTRADMGTVPVMSADDYYRDAKRPTKKSAKPSNFNFLTNQRPASEILTNDITWREIHFGFWTNQRTIKSLLASLHLEQLSI